MEKVICLFCLLLSIFTKLKSEQYPFLIEYVNLGRTFSILLFGSLLINSWDRKGLKNNLSAKVCYLSFLTLVSLIEFLNVSIPFVSDYKIEIIISIFLTNVIIKSMQLRSLVKGLEASLPEKNVKMGKRERKLRRAMWQFFKSLASNNSRTQVELDKTKEYKIISLSVLISIIFIFSYTIVFINEVIPFWIQLITWLLLPYSLSWTLGSLQLTKRSQFFQKEGVISLSGFYDLKFHKDDIEKIEFVSNYNKEDFHLSSLAVPVQKIIFKEDKEVWILRASKKIKSIIVPFELDLENRR